MRVLPLFSKVFYETMLDFSDDDLNMFKSVVDTYEIERSGVKTDTSNISLSTKTKELFKNPAFTELVKEINNEFTMFQNEYMKYTNNNFEITTSWATITKPKQESNFHNHFNSMYSGIFYINTPKNSGNIMFEDFRDKRYNLEPNEHNDYNSHAYMFEPKPGMLILFPSEVHHKILKNNSNEDRYSIAFNMIPKGGIGYVGSDSYFRD